MRVRIIFFFLPALAISSGRTGVLNFSLAILGLRLILRGLISGFGGTAASEAALEVIGSILILGSERDGSASSRFKRLRHKEPPRTHPFKRIISRRPPTSLQRSDLLKGLENPPGNLSRLICLRRTGRKKPFFWSLTDFEFDTSPCDEKLYGASSSWCKIGLKSCFYACD